MATRRKGYHGNGAGSGVLNGSAGSDYRFPASTKVYVRGTLHPDVHVPMREITLAPTHGHNGGPAEENSPLRVYDTSGPYTDPQATVDVQRGLPPLREPWIGARGEHEEGE